MTSSKSHMSIRLLQVVTFALLFHLCSSTDCAADPGNQDFTIQSVSPSGGSCLGETVVTIQAVFKMPNCSFLTGFGENLWNGLGPGGVLQTITIDGIACVLHGTINSDPNYQNILTCKVATISNCNTVSGAGKLVQILWNGKISQGGYMWSWIPCWSAVRIFPQMGIVSGGTVVTITGGNFSDIVTLQSVNNVVAYVTIDLYPCTNLNYINSTSITCVTTDAGQSTGQCQDVVITIDTMINTIAGAWAWIPRPLVSAVSPSHGPAQGGITITIDGTFGTKLHNTTVFMGSSGNATSLGCEIGANDVKTPNRISCSLPASQGLGNWIQVQETYLDAARMKQQESISSVKQYIFDYDAPSITSITPSASAPTGGAIMTINGINFGNYAPGSTNPISVALTTTSAVPLACTNVLWVSNQVIKCTIPAGAGYNLSVSVTADSQVSSNVAFFNYLPPNITSISPSTLGPTNGNGMITVTGNNFGAFPCLSRPNFCSQNVLVDGVACFQTVFISDQMLICSVRPGIGKNHFVTVDVSSQVSTQVFPMAYDAPVIESMSNGTAYPGGGNVILTINGRNFGPNDPIDNPISVRIMENTSYIDNATYVAQSFPCVTAKVTVDHYRITCLTSPGLGRNLPVIVTVGSQDSNWNYGFNYLAPQLLAFVRTYTPGPPWTTYFGAPPSALLPDGSNANITIQGLDDTFGYSGPPLDLNVAIGNKNCLSTFWIDSNTLSCVIPPGSGENLPVWITVAGQTNVLNTVRTFTYFPATVTNVSPLSGQGNVTLQLWGSNFGVSSDDDFFIQLGGKVCTQILRYNDSYATCVTPSNLRPVTVYVSVGGWMNPSPFTFVYDPCPVGTFADDVTVSCVSCDPGFYNDQPMTQSCQPCPHNSYQNQSQQAFCYPCPYQSAGLTVATLQLSECQCMPGWYGPNGTDCTQCPPGGDCPGGLQVAPAFGYWGNPNYLASFFPCSPKQACPGNYTCALDAFNRLCSKCPPDTFISSGLCKACPSKAATSAAIAFVSIGVMLAAAAIGKTNSLSKIKIIVSFTSIVSTMNSPTYRIPWPEFFTSFLDSMAAFLEVDMPFSWGASCLYEVQLSFFNKFILPAILPPIGAGCIILYFFFWRACRYLSGGKSSKQTEATKSRCIRNAVLLIFFCVPAICCKVASLYNCIQLDFGIYYLAVDPTIQCYTEEYMTYRDGGIFLLTIYGACVPLSMFLWLAVNHKHLDDEIFKMRYGFMYEDYEKKFFFWETLEMLRKLFFTAAIVILYKMDESSRLAIVVFVAYLYAVITIACKPYVDMTADSLQIYSMVTIYVIGFFGLVFKMNEISKSADTMSVTLIALVIFMIAFGVALSIVGMLGAKLRYRILARFYPELAAQQYKTNGQDMTPEERQRLEEFLARIKLRQEKLKKKTEADVRREERMRLLREKAEKKFLKAQRRYLKDHGEISDSESEENSEDDSDSDSSTSSESEDDSEDADEWDQLMVEQKMVNGKNVISIVPKSNLSIKKGGDMMLEKLETDANKDAEGKKMKDAREKRNKRRSSMKLREAAAWKLPEFVGANLSIFSLSKNEDAKDALELAELTGGMNTTQEGSDGDSENGSVETGKNSASRRPSDGDDTKSVRSVKSVASAVTVKSTTSTVRNRDATVMNLSSKTVRRVGQTAAANLAKNSPVGAGAMVDDSVPSKPSSRLQRSDSRDSFASVVTVSERKTVTATPKALTAGIPKRIPAPSATGTNRSRPASRAPSSQTLPKQDSFTSVGPEQPDSRSVSSPNRSRMRDRPRVVKPVDLSSFANAVAPQQRSMDGSTRATPTNRSAADLAMLNSLKTSLAVNSQTPIWRAPRPGRTPTGRGKPM
eukprot:GILJ01006091.1.p1 GENE.GILJ01006091.1~~GILJ01006091.1.p1  ORF type:complete len:1843 (-),score=227.55 GILJ01006091.1:235-5763(-)